MAGPTPQQEHAVSRAAKIYALLKQAAERGEGCPDNSTLAERFGCGTTAIVNAIHFLESNAMISVERGNSWRVVTIRATGHTTARTKPGASGDGDNADALNEALRKADRQKNERGIA